jgi:uncharacterized protein YbjT (DUF2867 family)
MADQDGEAIGRMVRPRFRAPLGPGRELRTGAGFPGPAGARDRNTPAVEHEALPIAYASTVAVSTSVNPSRAAPSFWRLRARRRGGERQQITLLSAVGTNIDSGNRFIRTKGEAEQAVIDAGIHRTSLFRPSLLVTKQLRYGAQDWLSQNLFPFVAPLLPRKYHQITVEDLGRAMRLNAERPGEGVEILHYPEFAALPRAA